MGRPDIGYFCFTRCKINIETHYACHDIGSVIEFSNITRNYLVEGTKGTKQVGGQIEIVLYRIKGLY